MCGRYPAHGTVYQLTGPQDAVLLVQDGLVKCLLALVELKS